VTDRYGDPDDDRSRHPAALQQLGEILARFNVVEKSRAGRWPPAARTAVPSATNSRLSLAEVPLFQTNRRRPRRHRADWHSSNMRYKAVYEAVVQSVDIRGVAHQSAACPLVTVLLTPPYSAEHRPPLASTSPYPP